jgi:hypothetical protein
LTKFEIEEVEPWQEGEVSDKEGFKVSEETEKEEEEGGQ